MKMTKGPKPRLLVEPSFTNRLANEDALLEAEFGPADEDGYYGRQLGAEACEIAGLDAS